MYSYDNNNNNNYNYNPNEFIEDDNFPNNNIVDNYSPYNNQYNINPVMPETTIPKVDNLNNNFGKTNSLFNYYGLIDQGKVPKISEDNMEGFTLLNDTVLCLCIADGLGSQIGTQISSVIVIKEMKSFLEKYLLNDDPEHIKYILELGFYTINRIMNNYRKINPELYSSFTSTLTIALITKNKNMIIGHVGNTRLYMLRDGNIYQITQDDTVAMDLLNQGQIKKEEYKTHPDRNNLTKFMGDTTLNPYIQFGTVAKDDLILLCTNGLFEMLTDEQIKEVIYETGNSKDACESLINIANEIGGIDNIATLISYIDF